MILVYVLVFGSPMDFKETFNKIRDIWLTQMRLSVMDDTLKGLLADPQFQNMVFEDRIGLLVDAEWSGRNNNHLNK